jgi:hypothetical protein
LALAVELALVVEPAQWRAVRIEPLRFQISNLKSEIYDLKSEIYDLKSEI